MVLMVLWELLVLLETGERLERTEVLVFKD